jgi:hypothetical protein
MNTRGRWLSTCAILFGLLAVSNLLKPLHLGGAETGFVLFGVRLEGTANLIAGPLFGIYLAVYSWSIWKMKKQALYMGTAYVVYVAANLVLFGLLNETPDTSGYSFFMFVYTAIALGVSGGAAVTLYFKRDELG